MNVPARFYSGDTVAWTEADATYPSPTWTMTVTFFRYGQAALSVTGSQSGSDHSFSISPTVSGGLVPGEWMWSASVTSGSDKYTIGNGTAVVRPNLATAVPGTDVRGPATIAYDNVVAAINTGAAQAAVTVTIGGRSVTYRGIDELVKAEAILRPRMESEKSAEAGTVASKLIRAQFGRA